MAETSVKIEFAVQMTCNNCENAVKAVLSNNSEIKSFSVDLANERVVVETNMQTDKIANLLESTGRRVLIRGIGSQSETMKGQDFGSGVSIVEGFGGQIGVARFYQVKEDDCVIEGTIDRLAANQNHLLNVHEFGDLSDGCRSCGNIFTGNSQLSKAPSVGQLGSVQSDQLGRATFRIHSDKLKLWDIIGRSFVVSSTENNIRLACGIIARSAGLFANEKKVCACSGKTLWDEKTTINKSK